MADKVLCPFCGAEMKRNWKCTGYGEAAREAWYVCEICKSDSPTVWGCNYETAVKLATEAALRRFTPPLKPMTRQELPRRYLMPCWIEQRGEDALPDLLDKDSTGFYGKFENLNARETNYLFYTNYGKTWRCWERKPSEEERSTAEWEK